MLIHHSINYTPLPTDHLFHGDDFAEHQGVTISAGDLELKIINIYIPPTASCPPEYEPNLGLLFDQNSDVLIMGDFNAHHPSWYSETSSTEGANRGEVIADWINGSNLAVLNDETPTRRPLHGPATSPDLTIASAHFALDYTWTPEISLRSDHLPIVVQLEGWSEPPPPEPFHTYTNLRKARWSDFLNETENLFASEPPPQTCSKGEKVFRHILKRAAKHHIPSGFIKNHIPNLPDEAKNLIRERDNIRQENSSDPRIAVKDQQIASSIAEANRNTWISTVESCSHNENSGKYWRLLGKLSGKKINQAPNQPITFGNTSLSNRQRIADGFCKQFTRVANHSPNIETRKVRRRITKNHPLDRSFSPFTAELVQMSIKNSGSSSAFGPDGLTILHLKHVGPRGM